MKSILSTLFITILSTGFTLYGQNEQNYDACNFSTLPNLMEIQPEGDFENVKVQKLCSDSLSTAFVIWVKKGVKAHKHVEHSETIYVIEGTGNMRINERNFDIKAGDFLFIPFESIHSVEVTSEIPLKVLSIQAPEFLGKDRVFID